MKILFSLALIFSLLFYSCTPATEIQELTLTPSTTATSLVTATVTPSPFPTETPVPTATATLSPEQILERDFGSLVPKDEKCVLGYDSDLGFASSDIARVGTKYVYLRVHALDPNKAYWGQIPCDNLDFQRRNNPIFGQLIADKRMTADQKDIITVELLSLVKKYQLNTQDTPEQTKTKLDNLYKEWDSWAESKRIDKSNIAELKILRDVLILPVACRNGNGNIFNPSLMIAGSDFGQDWNDKNIMAFNNASIAIPAQKILYYVQEGLAIKVQVPISAVSSNPNITRYFFGARNTLAQLAVNTTQNSPDYSGKINRLAKDGVALPRGFVIIPAIIILQEEYTPR